ncbi:MAG TPA: phosphoglycerate mutase family protein [Thermoanaerobaculia bacterium]|nr:phosphoglycerate mutase family protein [Thermoanaerobaculia bacterium]
MAGWTDIPLSRRGERQVEAMGRLLRMEGTAPILYSSSSARSLRTAAALARGRMVALRALRGIAMRHPGERVLAVTHAGVITQIIGHIHGESPARWEEWRPGNGSVTIIEWEEPGPRLVSFDDRSHLEDVSLASPRQRGG